MWVELLVKAGIANCAARGPGCLTAQQSIACHPFPSLLLCLRPLQSARWWPPAPTASCKSCWAARPWRPLISPSSAARPHRSWWAACWPRWVASCPVRPSRYMEVGCFALHGSVCMGSSRARRRSWRVDPCWAAIARHLAGCCGWLPQAVGGCGGSRWPAHSRPCTPCHPNTQQPALHGTFLFTAGHAAGAGCDCEAAAPHAGGPDLHGGLPPHRCVATS